MSFRLALLGPAILLLAACGGGGGGGSGPAAPAGPDIATPALESYRTDHNGFSRVRRTARPVLDRQVLAQFDDADPATPAGYRNLIARQEAVYRDKMFIEVVGQVETAGGTERAIRILRLTTDQAPFENVRNASGKYYFRGANYVWASLDGKPLQAGSDSRGLVDLVIDFDTGTADIDLRTTVAGQSELRSALVAEDLPFNVRTGAYGGAVTLRIWDTASSDILAAEGSLRGNIGGAPAYADNLHELTTSGLYTVSGRDAATGRSVKADGLFYGADPNALP